MRKIKYIGLLVIIILILVVGYKKKVNIIKEKAKVSIKKVIELNKEETNELLKELISKEEKRVNDSLKNETIILKINEERILVDCSSFEKEFDLGELNSEVPVKFSLENKNKKVQIKIMNKILDEEIEIKIEKIGRDIKIPINIVNLETGDGRTYYINTLNSKFPKYKTIGISPYSGDYSGDINSYNNDRKNKSFFIYKMNSLGKILYYKIHSASISDFKKTIVNGKIRYSYYIEDKEEYNYENVGYAPTKLIVMDENYKIIDIVSCKKYNNVPEGFPLENHDSIILDDNHYIVSTYFGENVNNIDKKLIEKSTGSRVVAAIIQEIKDGKVLWQWNSTDHPELYELSQEHNDYKNLQNKWADYIYFNSMTVDPKDNNLICSFRNIDSILKIERYTGNILWILGGKGDQFGLKEKEKFSRQHYARLLSDGSITLFDNGNKNKKSRILELKIDEVNKKLINYKEFYLNNHFSPACGSVNKIDEKKNVFMIGWGIGDFSNLENATEVDYSSNKKIFELIFEKNINTYRVVKIK
ncbi:MAG: aryl-sulfate sulfotransferase [Bacteroidaceae bacterium]|uniref:aryl-sulfate sulfotransferase n=1 Tax=Fusobacterium varium TaxID=856 RepID=UPI00242F0DF0|nr:aryl-sulfate sulfotransferase [Fusobacterium varium]MCF0171393.1 aryl-sulfate sulfotransferase [Fusobacterium varium]MCF0188816.1 aryl-sulfate sulfotransferase [Bacteroidaceae bacterium]